MHPHPHPPSSAIYDQIVTEQPLISPDSLRSNKTCISCIYIWHNMGQAVQAWKIIRLFGPLTWLVYWLELNPFYILQADRIHLMLTLTPICNVRKISRFQIFPRIISLYLCMEEYKQKLLYRLVIGVHNSNTTNRIKAIKCKCVKNNIFFQFFSHSVDSLFAKRRCIRTVQPTPL